MGKNYYDLLGVEKNASLDDIKRAYKKLARQHHPDVNSNADEEMFKEITEAYEVLRDSDKREIYDQYGEEGLKNGGGGMGGMGGFDIFDLFGGGGGGMGGMGRGGRPKGPVKAEPVKHAIPVTLEDLYNGTTKKIRVTRTRNCKACEGVGASKKDAVVTCTKCDGHGMVNEVRQVGPGFISQVRRPCDKCNGEGKSVDPKFICKTCNGKKVVSEQKVLEVFIEIGMKNGSKIVFEGEADERPGVQAGDIYFIVQEKPHALFKRDGEDLLFEKKINLSEALTGVEFLIEHLDKRKLHVKSKKGEVIKPGDTKMIANEGMPKHRNPFQKGSLLIKFDIEFPKKIPDNIASQLLKLLPPKAKIEKTSADMHDVVLEEPAFDEKSNARREAYNEDDEDDEGRQGISCGTQ
jgi:DnaJ family protein A protein 2